MRETDAHIARSSEANFLTIDPLIGCDYQQATSKPRTVFGYPKGTGKASSYDVAAYRSTFPAFVIFLIQLNMYEGARLWLGKEGLYIYTPVK